MKKQRSLPSSSRDVLTPRKPRPVPSGVPNRSTAKNRNRNGGLHYSVGLSKASSRTGARLGSDGIAAGCVVAQSLEVYNTSRQEAPCPTLFLPSKAAVLNYSDPKS